MTSRPLEVRITGSRGRMGYHQITYEANPEVMVDLAACPVCGDRIQTVCELVGASDEIPLASGVCLGCSLLMHQRRPSPAWFQAYYTSLYGQEADRGVIETPEPNPAVAAPFARLIPAGAAVLDVGCGDGRFLLGFRAAGYRVLGSEPCPHRASRARTAGVPVTDAPLEALPVDPMARMAGPFHLVLLNRVLEHILDPLAALRSVRALLAPGGLVYVNVPNVYGQILFKTVHYLPHVYTFGPRSLQEALRRAGLAVVHTKTTLNGLEVVATPAEAVSDAGAADGDPLPAILAHCLHAWGVPKDPASVLPVDLSFHLSFLGGTWEVTWRLDADQRESIRAAASWIASGARGAPPEVFPVRARYTTPRAPVWTT